MEQLVQVVILMFVIANFAMSLVMFSILQSWREYEFEKSKKKSVLN